MLSTLKSKLRPVFLTASLFALAASAQATTVVFGYGGTPGFTGGGSQDGPVNVGGVWLTVTPWASGWGDADLTVSWDGYGVDSGRHDDDEVDGDGRNEAVVLTFSAPVKITDIDLRNYYACCDEAIIFVDGSPAGSLVGSVFAIYAFDDDADFSVRSVDFTPIPEPASLLTAGVGLGLLGFARFRRK